MEALRQAFGVDEGARRFGERGDGQQHIGDIGRGILDAFEGYDYVVVPSGSCGGMIRRHLPGLFDDDPNTRARARALADRTFELVSFLVDVMGMDRVAASYEGTVTCALKLRWASSAIAGIVTVLLVAETVPPFRFAVPFSADCSRSFTVLNRICPRRLADEDPTHPPSAPTPPILPLTPQGEGSESG